MTMIEARELPIPDPGGILEWVSAHLGDLSVGEVRRGALTGGQSAADAALASFDVAGYAQRRNEVWPADRQGASRLSAYIRHGLLSLPHVWGYVEPGPARDVESFRSELLWQEYARHLYARLGRGTARSLRFAVPERSGDVDSSTSGWDQDLACLDLSVDNLHRDGWLTNQQRMWLASQHTVREGLGWRDGEDEFFRFLLDGSRAANRVGWQWTVGALTGKEYGFSRWQVEKRAPGLCGTCAREASCPISEWPDEHSPEPRAVVDPLIRQDPDLEATRGPSQVQSDGRGMVEAVWLTAESLGDDDPALAAWPDVPAVFVFDIALLTKLRLAAHRLVFLAECLADLATRRPLTIVRGDPVEVLAGRRLAATFAPVPGWRSRSVQLNLASIHPWPWLVPPHAGPLTSFTAWRRRARV